MRRDEAKAPEMNQRFSELEGSGKEHILPKLRLREGSGLPVVTGLFRAQICYLVPFPLTTLGLGSWPCFSPHSAAAGLSTSPHSYLLDPEESPKSWSSVLWGPEMTFEAWSDHLSVPESPTSPPERMLSFFGSIKSTI